MKKGLAFVTALSALSLLIGGQPAARAAQTNNPVTLTIAVVNNPDQRKLLELSARTDDRWRSPKDAATSSRRAG